MRATSKLFLVLLALASAPCPSWSSPGAVGVDATPQLVSRIAFGSCAKQGTPQPIWSAISEFDPHIFIWLGDNIYGDNKRPLRVFGKERTIGPWKNLPLFFASPEQELRERYRIQKSNPGYSNLRSRAQIIGTWDDHDFGLNDAGKEFSGKNISQKLMLEFLDESPDSPRFKQSGVYASYTYGPVGKQIKVILLDTRYHRDPIGSDGSILGEEQWAWLEKELYGPKTDITIIGSSIQVISNLSATTSPLFYMESWGRFPKERKRLFNLINQSKRNGIFFISGDVHFSEITRFDCATGYPLYDVTSSGITQSVENAVPLLSPLVRFLARVTPCTMRIYNSGCRYSSCIYGKPNFGAIEIDWDATPRRLRLETRDLEGKPVMGVNLSFSDLRNSESLSKSTVSKNCIFEADLPWILRRRLSILIFSFLGVSIVLLVLILCVAVWYLRRCLRKCKKGRTRER
ncbi:calcineurin-like metallo-phosphoesterase superfamily protein isoform X2 [Wolffia australiana]